VIVSKYIDLKRDELSEREWRRLFSKLTFFDADQREVKSYRLLKGGRVRIPRGAWSLLPNHVEYEDRRIRPSGASLTFGGTLDYSDADVAFEGQQDALRAILDQEQGLVIAQPGFGKTMVALAAICEMKTPTLVLVHTKDVFDQWTDYAAKWIPGVRLGEIQGQPDKWVHGDIDVAMVQTMREYLPHFRREWADKYGAVIVDEAHHAPADTWEQILNAIPAVFRLGFTATKTRADGLHPFMKALIGPIIYEQKFKSKVPVEVMPLKTSFRFSYRGRYDWSALLAALISDPTRNKLIGEAVQRQVAKGQSVLVLSRRIEHLERMEAEINLDDAVVLTGRESRTRRREILDKFRSGEIRCVLSTQLFDEAIDAPIISRVFLTFPGKHDGRIIQQIGRALREHTDKDNAIVFDVVDDKVSVLRRQWMERKRTYGKLKIKVKKTKGGDAYVSTAAERRLLAHRVRERLGRGG
jgi:superfamily II DNA or RNA helicase